MKLDEQDIINAICLWLEQEDREGKVRYNKHSQNAQMKMHYVYSEGTTAFFADVEIVKRK